MDDLRITAGLTIPARELSFTAARASGPGGQHVNTTASAVTLVFDVAGSETLTGGQKARVLEKLASRLDSVGVLRVTARDERSQLRNLELARERLAAHLERALRRPKLRRATRPTKASKERRITRKKQRSTTKKLRGKVD